MSQHDELGEFLAGEYQVGRLDSRGSFTLDPARARERLRHWRLAEPRGYVLALVAAATASRSPYLRLTTGAEPTLCLRAFPVDLLNLLPGLVLGTLSRAEQALAVAVNSALGEGHSVEILAPGGGASYSGEQEPEPLEVPDGPAEMTFRLRPRAARRRFFGWFSGPEPERALLQSRALQAPLEILVDGRPLARPQAPACELWAFYSSGQRWLTERAPTARVTLRAPSPGPWDLELRFGGGAEGLVLVVDGVSVPLASPWPFPGLEAVLAAPDVRLDLSWSGPVPTPEWQRLLTQARQQVYDLLEQVEQRKSELGPSVLSFLEPLLTRYCQRGQLERASELCAWMRERWEQSPQHGFERGRFFYRYALVSRRLGRSPLAEALERIAQGEFEEAAQRQRHPLTWPARAAGDPPLRLSVEQAAQLARLECDQAIMGPGDVSLNEKLAREAGEAERRGELPMALYCWRWLVELAAAAQESLLEWRLARLGQVLLDWSPSQARAALRRALYLHLQSEQPQPRESIALLGALARAEAALENPAEAVELLRRCLAIQQQTFGPEAPELGPNLYLLAEQLERSGRAADAASVRQRLTAR